MSREGMEPQLENHVLPFQFGFPTAAPLEYFAQHIDLSKKDVNVNTNIFREFPSLATSVNERLGNNNVNNKPPEEPTPPPPPPPPPKRAKPKPKSSPGGKTHSCYVCGKVLSCPSSYYVHMKQHSGNKPYHCPMCDVSFCRRPYLDVHMRTHTGERPFQCSFCSKRFTQKSSLNVHRRSHTGEKPYSCDFCDKKFAVKSHVDAHRWTHSFEKPLLCAKCHIPFNSKSQYLIHMKTHIVYGFACPCGRSYTKESYLIRHKMKVHNPQTVPSTAVSSPGSVYSRSTLNADDLKNAVFVDMNYSSLTRKIKLEPDEANNLNLAAVASAIQQGMQTYGPPGPEIPPPPTSHQPVGL